MRIKILSTLTAVVLASSVMTSSIFALDPLPEIPDVLILGDSISTGYGLSEGTPSYGEIVADYIDADYTNLAVNGDTSADLLNLLTEDETVINAVNDAEIICISIGGNDMLGTLMTALSQYMDEDDTWLDAKDKILADQAGVIALSIKLNQNVTTAVNNIVSISQAIGTINSDAEVIFQTVYNPFEIYTENGNALAELHTFSNIYLGKINDGIKSLSDVTVVDTYTDFAGYGWLYTNITSQDVHPNKLGHMEIACQIVSSLGEVSFESVFASMLKTLSTEELALIPSDILGELIPVETTVPTDETSDETTDETTDETSDVTTDETSDETTDETTDETSDVTTDETSDVTTDVTTDETTNVEETTFATDTTPEDFVPLYGDVDLNGKVGLLDIIEFNKYIVGAVDFNASQRENANCLYDDVLNAADNMMIAAYLCKKVDVLGPQSQPVEPDVTTVVTDVTTEDETTTLEETEEETETTVETDVTTEDETTTLEEAETTVETDATTEDETTTLEEAETTEILITTDIIEIA